MSKRLTAQDFIKKATKIHNGKYNYSKVEYKNNSTKVCIICPEHGEFWQSPYKHLLGQGCPECCSTKKSSTTSFVEKAEKIHDHVYDYSKVNYANKETKVCIICPEHGEFWQTPHNHLKGQGCPICGKSKTKPKKYTTTDFITKAKEIHGDKYDYLKTKYSNVKDKICIICPEHGEFWQTPESHLRGEGCPKCGHVITGAKKRKDTETFISQAIKTHGHVYDYSKVDYISAKNKVCIVCPTHGEFWQSPWHHLNGCGCPKCVSLSSKAEDEIADYVSSLVGRRNIERHNRTILNGKEIDIYIPSLKIGIEYNGLYWHTEKRCEKNTHFEKTESASSVGIKLIQIFEDEYQNNKEIVMDKIAHIMGFHNNLPIVGARKCLIKEITGDEAKIFLNKNHIQGFVGSTLYLGAFYKGQLIAVMLFKKENQPGKWELTRFATDMTMRCPGMGDKLFKYFTRNYNPIAIKSFADRRWTVNETDNLYIKLGFIMEDFTRPDYRYYKPIDGCLRQHKFKFRKDNLHKKYGLPLSMTETEMVKKIGYERIWDCGLIKYVWHKNI